MGRRVRECRGEQVLGGAPEADTAGEGQAAEGGWPGTEARKKSGKRGSGQVTGV